jgi:two-component system, NarL family, sensor kinase
LDFTINKFKSFFKLYYTFVYYYWFNKIFRMNNLRCLLIFCLLSFVSVFCLSQQNFTSDTIKINQLLSKANYFKDANPDSSFFYAEKSMELSLKINSLKHISLANQSLGRCYTIKEDFGKATFYFLEALKIEEKRHDNLRIADIYLDMGYIYQTIENFNKSLQYSSAALFIFEKYRDTLNIARSLIKIGNLHVSREYCEKRDSLQRDEDYKTALKYYEKSLLLSELIHNKQSIIFAHSSIGYAYVKLAQPQKAIWYLKKTLDYYQETNNWNGFTETLYQMGRAYCQLKQYDKSANCYLECIKESKSRKLTQGIQFVYEELAFTYDEAGDYKNARDNYVTYMTIRDSIYNNEKSKQIFELETKYQTEKKEKEILSLSLKEKKQSLFILILISIILIIFLLGLYIIFRVRTKRKLAEQTIEIKEQKIRDLNREHQLHSTQLVLEGEETERKRIARDLHDGLGGLLSGVKLSFSNLKGNLMIPGNNVKDFDQALNMLDTSIKELRRVAHNMMPEGLVKFGLKDALSDFCESLNTSASPKVKFQFFGEFKRIEQKVEIGAYRIVQELINNAIKHAEASELVVQMIQESDRLSLIVQDNGKGFDINIAKLGSGIGLNSVKTRIDALNGHMDIHSEPEKGSEFTIDFNL